MEIDRGAAAIEEPTDARILSLPGGRRILEARDAAERLLDRLLGARRDAGGALDGWSDISRRGRLEHLIITEHLADDLEFIRRRLDGEQLHLSRETARPGAGRGTLVWDLTVAALGSPRLASIGAAIALRRRLAGEGSSFRLLVNGEVELSLSSLEEIEAALDHPPVARPGPPAASGLAWDLDGSGEVYGMSSEPGWPGPDGLPGPVTHPPARQFTPLPPPEGEALRGQTARFQVEPRRLTLLLPSRDGAWMEAAGVSLPAGP